MANEEIEISELEFTEELANDNLIPVESSTDTKATSLQILKKWLSSFFVGKTGNETIAGVKTFINTQKIQGEAKLLELKASDIDLTTTTSSTKAIYIDYIDKNGTRIGAVGGGQFPNGDSKIYLQIGNITNLSICKRSNNSVYTYVPTPPASDNSNQIATTNWVKSNASSIVESGNNYIKFSDKTLICWGLSSEDNISTVNLPKPYNNTDYIVVALPDRGSANTSDLFVHSKTTTSFKLQEHAQKSEKRNWLSIGKGV